MDPTTLLIWVGRLLALGRAVKGASPAVKAAYRELEAEITSGLPQGTTVEDLIRAAEANRVLSAIVRARHS